MKAPDIEFTPAQIDWFYLALKHFFVLSGSETRFRSPRHSRQIANVSHSVSLTCSPLYKIDSSIHVPAKVILGL